MATEESAGDPEANNVADSKQGQEAGGGQEGARSQACTPCLCPHLTGKDMRPGQGPHLAQRASRGARTRAAINNTFCCPGWW